MQQRFGQFNVTIFRKVFLQVILKKNNQNVCVKKIRKGGSKPVFTLGVKKQGKNVVQKENPEKNNNLYITKQ